MTARRMLALVCLAVGCAASEPGETVRVTIPEGASVSAIGEILEGAGVVSSARRFALTTSITGRDRSLQAGVYDLHRDSRIRDVIETLSEGQVAQQRLVVPEGLTVVEIAELVERDLEVPADSFRAAARDPELIDRLGIPEPTLEGFLYPSTYLVRIGAPADEIVAQMVAEFERRWKPSWTSRAAELELSRYEVIILASIIEGEVRDGEDRAYVSSVYHNRLERGMRLQADPTVIYALGERRRLFERDYRIRSEYNTYLIDGLPPTPIGQPSEPSIEAALYPAKTDFLFFVAGPDGKHVFSRTLREHVNTIRRLRSGPN